MSRRHVTRGSPAVETAQPYGVPTQRNTMIGVPRASLSLVWVDELDMRESGSKGDGTGTYGQTGLTSGHRDRGRGFDRVWRWSFGQGSGHPSQEVRR